MKVYISIYSDLFEPYFSSRNKFNKTPFDYNLISIIDNPDNIPVISKKYVEHLNGIFHEDSSYYDDYTSYMTYLIDNNCEVVSTSNKESINEEFIEISNNSECKTLSILPKDKGLSLDNYLCLEDIDKCPKSKTFLSILRDRSAVVRYNDFADNNQLRTFFKSIFSFPQNSGTAYIFDRYANVNHSCFDYFIEQDFFVKYYMLNASLLDGNSLTRKFNRVELYNTSNRDLLHERTVIIGDLILSVDEDPFNLDTLRRTWTITVEFSENNRNIILDKCSSFSKVPYV